MDQKPIKSSHLPVNLRIKFRSETLVQFIERYSTDVSRGGIFIRTREPLPVGTQLKLDFQYQGGTPLLTGDGTVVWIREFDAARAKVPPGMGVRFDKLAPESQAVLEQILLEKAKKEGAKKEGHHAPGEAPDRGARSASEPAAGRRAGAAASGPSSGSSSASTTAIAPGFPFQPAGDGATTPPGSAASPPPQRPRSEHDETTVRRTVGLTADALARASSVSAAAAAAVTAGGAPSEDEPTRSVATPSAPPLSRSPFPLVNDGGSDQEDSLDEEPTQIAAGLPSFLSGGAEPDEGSGPRLPGMAALLRADAAAPGVAAAPSAEPSGVPSRLTPADGDTGAAPPAAFAADVAREGAETTLRQAIPRAGTGVDAGVGAIVDGDDSHAVTRQRLESGPALTTPGADEASFASGPVTAPPPAEPGSAAPAEGTKSLLSLEGRIPPGTPEPEESVTPAEPVRPVGGPGGHGGVPAVMAKVLPVSAARAGRAGEAEVPSPPSDAHAKRARLSAPLFLSTVVALAVASFFLVRFFRSQASEVIPPSQQAVGGDVPGAPPPTISGSEPTPSPPAAANAPAAAPALPSAGEGAKAAPPGAAAPAEPVGTPAGAPAPAEAAPGGAAGPAVAGAAPPSVPPSPSPAGLAPAAEPKGDKNEKADKDDKLARTKRRPLARVARATPGAGDGEAAPAGANRAGASPYELRVTSKPVGADVSVDGQVVGKTPFVGSVPDLTSSHFVTLRKDGFELFEEVIGTGSPWAKVKASRGGGTVQQLKVNAKLKPLPGTAAELTAPASDRPAGEAGPKPEKADDNTLPPSETAVPAEPPPQ